MSAGGIVPALVGSSCSSQYILVLCLLASTMSLSFNDYLESGVFDPREFTTSTPTPESEARTLRTENEILRMEIEQLKMDNDRLKRERDEVILRRVPDEVS